MNEETYQKARAIMRRIEQFEEMKTLVADEKIFYVAASKHFGDDIMDVLKSSAIDRLEMEISSCRDELGLL